MLCHKGMRRGVSTKRIIKSKSGKSIHDKKKGFRLGESDVSYVRRIDGLRWQQEWMGKAGRKKGTKQDQWSSLRVCPPCSSACMRAPSDDDEQKEACNPHKPEDPWTSFRCTAVRVRHHTCDVRMLWAAHRGMSIHREDGQDWWREDGLTSAKQSEKADAVRAQSR